MSIDGIFNVLKPPGPTSFQVVAQIRRWSGEKKVGHTGTLDPLASGTFPVCLGQATKIAPYFLEAAKTYRATIELGTVTDTYDSQGKVLRQADPSFVTKEMLEQALASFTGVIWQKPPPYSALKQHGKRLYELARAGIAVDPPARQVQVLRLELMEWQPPLLVIEMECGRGIYLRSIAYDLGERLGCGAYLKELVRLKYGVFTIEDAVTLSQLEAAFKSEEWRSLLRPLDEVLASWRKVPLGNGEVKAIANGRPIPLPVRGKIGERVRAYSPQGQFCAILRFHGQLWHPERLFLANR